MIDLGKRNLLGILINAVDYDAAVADIMTAARERRGFAVSALAVHGVMTGAFDAQYRYRLNCLDLVTPDGQPVRWALNLLYHARLADRVYGPTLTLKVMQACGRERTPIFLYGATNALLLQLRKVLAARFPDLIIAGCEPSRFRCISRLECSDIAHRIRTSGAQITFVGTGCPRQEVWAYEFRDILSMPVLAVGAAFSFLAGLVPQAPGWMQSRGLEWLFRLAKEPSRLWKRYTLLNPLYVAMVGLQLCGKSFSPQGIPPLPGPIPG
jgi:exopolysaccharide biosynthesis WecB/TagA/CpsF family protein